jgi:Retroviral aspartyl protease
VVRLNASALSDPNSLRVLLRSFHVSKSSFPFSALVDSGSTHCFVDSGFARQYDLPTNSVPPIDLKLFDGSSNAVITQSVLLPVSFPSGESISIDFYVTPLDPSCSAVLGYNWLTRYNPLIDWVLGSIIFRSPLLDPSIPSPTSSARTATLLQNNSVSDETPKPSDSVPHISLIGAAAFMRACKRPGAQCFSLHLSDPFISAKSVSASDEAPDLSKIPKEYHDYADVFSKAEADKLAPHRPYDLKINLEEGTTPPPITAMYSLSRTELETLREFIDENLRRGFIR